VNPRGDPRHGPAHSGAVRRIFQHNDLDHLEELLAASDPATPKIVAFESV
jgi:5-aminolevulinate synthase